MRTRELVRAFFSKFDLFIIFVIMAAGLFTGLMSRLFGRRR